MKIGIISASLTVGLGVGAIIGISQSYAFLFVGYGVGIVVGIIVALNENKEDKEDGKIQKG